MKHKVILGKKSIDYIIRKSKRAKRLSLTIYSDGRLVVTAPHRLIGQQRIDKILKKKQKWILKKMELMIKNQDQKIIENTRANYLKYKEQARSLVNDKLGYYNQLYRFKFKKVAIKNQKTRWGSCSSRANLNFNYRLIFLPTALVDYIIVHELCHLQELNHSQKFWQLVAETIPRHKQARQELKKYSLRLY